ncbi:MAG: hypothetical protein HKN17_04275 [Rhodothermales bacterium]|nr:hypothetical protein [Rhodothermales bacterium]
MRMTMWRLISNLCLAFILVTSFSACDSGNGDDGDDGGNGGNLFQANITISGDVQDSFSGFAAFAEDGDGDGGFIIFIYQGEFSVVPSGRIVAVGHDTASPGQGTFTINEEDYYGAYASDLSSVTTGTFISGDSGQLNITSSSSDRLSGSFSFTGEVVQNAAVQGTATVSGTFTAEQFSPGEIPGFF